MTYARARLWLGILGVGSVVVLTGAMLATQIPHRFMPSTEAWGPMDVVALAVFVGSFLLAMLPFDILGGHILPKRFGKTTERFNAFLTRWFVGVAIQSTLFVATGLVLLWAGRAAGLIGAVGAVVLAALTYLVLQRALASLFVQQVQEEQSDQLARVRQQLVEWGVRDYPLIVVKHSDPGFTGGVIGIPGRERIVLPALWFESLSQLQVAAVVARRSEAISSGSRNRGLLVALGWIVIGFVLAALVPGAGVGSVAQLITTCCGFTIWSFLGLLILPTISRHASYTIDRRITQRGIPVELLAGVTSELDRLQDDEPQRPAWLETIFHPVPSVKNRQRLPGSDTWGAWHAARMTLYLSWSCLGLLSRAVHCNAGRPELWVMLPTD